MDTIGQRLKAAMDAKGYGVDDLVSRKVLSRAGVYQWLNDTVKADKVRGVTVDKICRALGVNRDWLLHGRGPMDDGESPLVAELAESPDWPDITGYSQQVGLSDGAEAIEYAETHKLKFRADSLRRKRLNPRDLAVFYGKGDSMEPRIHSGDAILFDQADTRLRDGHLFVILVPGAGAESYSVKRCEILDDIVYFRADNPKGDHNWRKARRMDDERHPIKIIGRVRWIGSWEG